MFLKSLDRDEKGGTSSCASSPVELPKKTDPTIAGIAFGGRERCRRECVPTKFVWPRTGYTSLSPHPGYPMPEYANGYSTAPYSTTAYSCGYTAGAYQQGAPPNGFSQNPCYSMPPPQQDKLSVSSKDDR